MVYGRPMEVRKRTICNSNSTRKNQGANLPVFGRVGVHSNTPWTLGEHLTAAGGDGGRVDFLRTVRGVVRSREGGRAARRGRRYFFAVVFSAICHLFCRKWLRAGRPKYEEFIRSQRQAMGDGVRKADASPNLHDL